MYHFLVFVSVASDCIGHGRTVVKLLEYVFADLIVLVGYNDEIFAAVDNVDNLIYEKSL